MRFLERSLRRDIAGASVVLAQSFPDPPYTVVPSAPVIREKPFLFVDPRGTWNVFVPALRSNATGPTWGAAEAQGVSHPLSEFVIVKPGSSVSAMNGALAHDKHLIITRRARPLPGFSCRLARPAPRPTIRPIQRFSRTCSFASAARVWKRRRFHSRSTAAT